MKNIYKVVGVFAVIAFMAVSTEFFSGAGNSDCEKGSNGVDAREELNCDNDDFFDFLGF